MNVEQLTAGIALHDPILAQAVSRMVGYIQDKWASPYPTKEQPKAVNDYLRSVHADSDGTMNETNIAHRKIASQEITINAIRVLDHDKLDRLQDVLNHIASTAPLSTSSPKSIVPNLRLEWENFLLACQNCNSTKGDTNINADNINTYVWPDTDDTYHLIEYDAVTAMPRPAANLPQDLAEKVQRLISLVGLDKPQPKVGTVAYNKCADRRVESRFQVLDLARQYHKILLTTPEGKDRDTLIDAMIDLSKAYGHWSIWMHTFEDIPEVRTKLLDSLPGTRKDCFKEE